MYQLSNLPYSYDSLEPYIGAKTLELHYDKLYRGYLDRLNKVLNEVGYDYRYSIQELVNHIDEFPMDKRGDILYNVGGVLNHRLYFNTMSPNKNNIPVGKLKDAINRQYGSFENFKQEFIKVASFVVGSGYTFLVLTEDKKLEIMNTSNQETPYLYHFIPIMTIDLWEHAYYLNYYNNRQEYILNFFNVVDFVKINELYEENL